MSPGKKEAAESHEMLDLVPVNNKEGDSTSIVCVIRDETTVNWRSSRIVQSLPDNTNMVSLYKIVAEKANYVKNSFLLAFLKPASDGQTEEEIILDDKCDTTLREVVGDNPGKRSNFNIKSREGMDPIKHVQQPTVNSKFEIPP